MIMSEEQKELQVSTPPAKAPITVSLSPHGGLVPTDIDGLWRLATIMVKSGFMPKAIQTTEAVFVAVQMGLEVGLSPMQAVQNIAVINGRPALWGDAMIGLVEASGALEEFKEYYQGDYGTDDFRAVCVAKRRGHEAVIINEFSIADAKIAGLWLKDGPWRTYPKRMLKMRARGFTLRDGFADKLKGLKSAEELMDTPGDPEYEMKTMANKQLIEIDAPPEPEPRLAAGQPIQGASKPLSNGPDPVGQPASLQTEAAQGQELAGEPDPGF
jgi:hypothetical protein